jgi:hypothetical protein
MLACFLVGSADAGPGRRVIPVAAHVTGMLDFQLNGTVIDVIVNASGHAGSLGRITAQATWSPDAMALTELFFGDIDELSIGNGTFSATFDGGATVSGTLQGIVRARHDGRFDLDAQFTVTHGTGSLAGATGAGTLNAIQDVESLESNATFKVKLGVP